MKCLWIILLLLPLSEPKSTPQSPNYVAAVVEYEVNRNVEQNRVAYTQLIEQAAKQNADIIVFPEMTLTNNSVSFPVPIHGLLAVYPIPAVNPEFYDSLLVSMSQAARDNQIYVVINVRELMDCRSNDTGEYCPEAKEYIFNTNVVFDRTGAVIDRYRKINLFGEYAHTPALHPDLGIFTTDFGVTFGHFICFDLMFQVPAVQVVQKHNITDVIFPTMWFSELPYLTAVEIQEAYAYSLNVNFLGAGANNVGIGSTGSGIYSGKAGALISIMSGVPTTRLLVATVPKIPGQVIGPVPGSIYENPTDHDALLLISDPSLPSHISRPLTKGFQEFTINDKDVSCTFRVKISNNEGENYPHFRAIVQDGSNTYARREIGVAGCSIVACKDDDFKSCVFRYDSNKIKSGIQELEIIMRSYPRQYNTSLDCDNTIYFPVTLRTNKYPLVSYNFTYIDNRDDVKDKDNKAEEVKSIGREDIFLKINGPQEDLVAIGVWGRIFTRDIDHNKGITVADIDEFNDVLSNIFKASDENKIL